MNRTLAAIASLWLGSIALADDFDRLEGPLLARLAGGGDGAEPRDRLSIVDLAAMPNLLAGVRSPVVIVRTDLGNPGRLIVSPGFRSPPPAEGADPDADPPEPVPILVIERFAAFEANGGAAPDRLASGNEVLLFEGFLFDLDSGQVVPEGQGGDLRFVGSAEGEPGLEPADGASMLTLSSRPEFPEAAPGEPSSGRSILPGDYAGRYRLFADGSQSGTLDLAVEDRVVSGRFRSDQTGSTYEVSGEVDAGPEPMVRFSVQFPRSRQDYSGNLFSEGKGAMVGTLILLDRERPFFAVREGGRVLPDGNEPIELPGETVEP